MRPFLFLCLTLLLSQCGPDNTAYRQPSPAADTIARDITTAQTKDTTATERTPKVYSNERFRNVTVERLGEHAFRVTGEGQIFEAAFSWVVEDGHNELAKGHAMTNAGAPEWGRFDFTVDATKQRTNSTLTLILFESSPKDGSRTFELPIPLY